MIKGLNKQDLLGIGMTSQRRRNSLVQRLQEKGISDLRVLDVMRKMPRHLFVDEAMANRAYEDCALPIGHGQTISQPYIVARMTAALLGDETQARPKKVLEVGTGSGYQAAILALLVEQVYSVERIKALYERTRKLLLTQLKFDNLHFQYSDGSWGWSEHAPYDAIMVTAAPEKIPHELLQQLAIGGRMVAPVGGVHTAQRLLLIQRSSSGFEELELDAVSFVPFLSGQD